MKYSWGRRSGDAIWCKLNLNDNKMPWLLEKKSFVVSWLLIIKINLKMILVKNLK